MIGTTPFSILIYGIHIHTHGHILPQTYSLLALSFPKLQFHISTFYCRVLLIGVFKVNENIKRVREKERDPYQHTNTNPHQLKDAEDLLEATSRTIIFQKIKL